MNSRKSSGALVLAVVLLGSCKSDGPGSVDDFCAQYAAAICQVATSCGTSTAGCQSYQHDQCVTTAGQATTGGAGNRHYTGQNAANCINQLKAAYGNSAPITPGTLARIDRACQYVYQGSLGLHGGWCETDYDCAGPTDGTVICDQFAHQCAVKNVLAGGQAWHAAGDVCAPNFYFPVLGPGAVCQADGSSAAASACTNLAPCDSNSRCVYGVNGDQNPGVCMPLVGSGEGCGQDNDCSPAAPYCDIWVYPAVCTAGLQFGPGARECNCVTGPCTGAGGAIGGLGGSSGRGVGGTGGAGGSSGIGGSSGAGGTAGAGNRDGGNADAAH